MARQLCQGVSQEAELAGLLNCAHCGCGVSPLDTALPCALAPCELETPLPEPAKAFGAAMHSAPTASAAASFFMRFTSPSFAPQRTPGPSSRALVFHPTRWPGRPQAVPTVCPCTGPICLRHCRLRLEATSSLSLQVPRRHRARRLQTAQPPLCEIGSWIPFRDARPSASLLDWISRQLRANRYPMLCKPKQTLRAGTPDACIPRSCMFRSIRCG